MKTCTKCLIEKDDQCFAIQNGRRRASCKQCRNEHHLKLNPPKPKRDWKEYYKEYMKIPKNRIAQNLRRRINKIVKSKTGSAVGDLGCSIKDFILYMESKFSPGMTWDNYGINGWHVDHIKPLAKFDLSDPEQFKQACHFSNLQPLWAEDNRRKRDKWQL